MNSTKKKKIIKRNIIMLSIATAIAMVCAVPVLGWFTRQRRMSTFAKVKSPTALNIGAGNKEDSVYIDLGDIDVEDSMVTSKSFVFCVYSDENKGNYKLQLAHTTNIPFTYKIYSARATDDENQATVTYVSQEDSNTYYYKKGEEIQGAYLNKQADKQIANENKHNDTYGDYNNVQINAEPLYWQNTSPINPVGIENESGFVDYYILELSWTTGEIKNDKETDIVYLTAGMV